MDQIGMKNRMGFFRSEFSESDLPKQIHVFVRM